VPAQGRLAYAEPEAKAVAELILAVRDKIVRLFRFREARVDARDSPSPILPT
jgi:hypothetical protein